MEAIICYCIPHMHIINECIQSLAISVLLFFMAECYIGGVFIVRGRRRKSGAKNNRHPSKPATQNKHCYLLTMPQTMGSSKATGNPLD